MWRRKSFIQPPVRHFRISKHCSPWTNPRRSCSSSAPRADNRVRTSSVFVHIYFRSLFVHIMSLFERSHANVHVGGFHTEEHHGTFFQHKYVVLPSCQNRVHLRVGSCRFSHRLGLWICKKQWGGSDHGAGSARSSNVGGVTPDLDCVCKVWENTRIQAILFAGQKM